VTWVEGGDVNGSFENGEEPGSRRVRSLKSNVGYVGDLRGALDGLSPDTPVTVELTDWYAGLVIDEATVADGIVTLHVSPRGGAA
jgi:hypothetical protein